MGSITEHEIQDILLDLNIISEIAEKKRSEDQVKRFEDIKTFLYENSDLVFGYYCDHVFADSRLSEDFEGGRLTEYRRILDDPQARPKTLPVGRSVSGDELAEAFTQLHHIQVTMGHHYEEMCGIIVRLEYRIEQAEKACRAVWDFDKVDKGKSLFEALIPPEITQGLSQLYEIKERFKRRLMQADKCEGLLTQIKLVKFNENPEPRRIMSDVSSTPAAPVSTTQTRSRPAYLTK